MWSNYPVVKLFYFLKVAGASSGLVIILLHLNTNGQETIFFSLEDIRHIKASLSLKYPNDCSHYDNQNVTLKIFFISSIKQ